MSEAEYIDDIGGYYADQDFYAEECGEYDGNCLICPYRYECDCSDLKKRTRKDWN